MRYLTLAGFAMPTLADEPNPDKGCYGCRFDPRFAWAYAACLEAR